MFWVSVIKDAVVATINNKNPVIDIILEKGSSDEFLIIQKIPKGIFGRRYKLCLYNLGD